MAAEEYYIIRNNQDTVLLFTSFGRRKKKFKSKATECLNLISVKGMHDLPLCRLQSEDKLF